jgi:hypothetical protein
MEAAEGILSLLEAVKDGSLTPEEVVKRLSEEGTDIQEVSLPRMSILGDVFMRRGR